MAKKEIPTLKDVARVPEELQPVVAWWQDHGPKTLAWAVAALAVCVGLYVWHGTDQAQDAAAAVALAQASDVEGFPQSDRQSFRSPESAGRQNRKDRARTSTDSSESDFFSFCPR